MDLPRNMTVDINIQNKVLLLTSDEGDVARIDPGYFADCPRKAIRLADIMAKSPELYEFVKTVVPNLPIMADHLPIETIRQRGVDLLKSIDEVEDAG